MTANFWNTQNIAILAVAMLAIPTGAGAGLYLLKKSKGTDESTSPAPVAETPPLVVQPAPVVFDNTPPPSPGEDLSPEAERFLDRIADAASESELSHDQDKFREAIEGAAVVERLHCVNFNPGKLSLDTRDEHYLVNAVKASDAFREHAGNPNAIVAVLGYASKDGDPRNNRYALTRARAAQTAIRDHEAEIGFIGTVRSWCVGETDKISSELGGDCSGFDRAAEIWLIVDNKRTLASIKSDNFVSAQPVRKSSCGSQH